MLVREAWRSGRQEFSDVQMPQVRSALYDAFYEAGRRYGFPEDALQSSLSHMPYQRVLLYPRENIPEFDRPYVHGNGNHKYYIPAFLSSRGKVAMLHLLAAQRARLQPDYEKTPENLAGFYTQFLQVVGENKAALLGNGCLRREDLHEIKWRLKRARRSAHISKRGR